MTEKSGIEMIEDIMSKINLLERRFVVMEQMVKELLSRANGFVPNVVETRPTVSSTAVQKTGTTPMMNKQATIAPTDMAKKNVKIGDLPISNTDTKTRVMGKIKGSDGRFISGVNVKIHNINHQVIKETKTNRAGDWMCFLPPGRYNAEYYLKDIIHANVNFNVEAGQTVFRVAQPQL